MSARGNVAPFPSPKGIAVPHTSHVALVAILAASFACARTADRPAQPNIVFIMADDMGFSDIAPYGGEIATPTLDALAAGGVRLTQFYNSVRCWPSRASLVTGRYPHQVGLGGDVLLSNRPLPATGGPAQGFLSDVPTLADRLHALGYGTYLSGKWHLGERPEHWPRQRGFDRYFGLISGASSFFEMIDEPGRPRAMALDDNVWTPPADGFYMTDATTDHAIEFLTGHWRDRPSSPFFLYVAYTAPHWPLHAKDEDIARYAGRYDAGWDAVRAARVQRLRAMGITDDRHVPAPRPASIPAWTDATDKPTWSRRMEVYAAMIDSMDRNIGRLVDTLRAERALDNTLIVFLSDNGGSDEDPAGRGLNNPEVPIGRRGSYAGYLAPWAYVSNTPFRGYKAGVYEGGGRSPFIAHWPAGIGARGAIDTTTVGHIIDLASTALDVAGVSPDLVARAGEGTSLLPALRGGTAGLAPRNLYWEHLGWRAIRSGPWKLVRPRGANAAWELYDLAADPAEQRDLATQEPERVAQLSADWEAWAARVGAAR
jgi:arylsulfatase A-like enzyme